jgi:hypothetical protein
MFDPGHTPLEMTAKVGNAGAVLAQRAVPHAVEEDGLEALEFVPRQGECSVDDHATQLLAQAARHDARLAKAECEPFLDRDGADDRDEPIGKGREPGASRKGQVVGITPVLGIEAAGQLAQASIEAISGEVGELRRGRSPLRKVSRAQELACAKALLCVARRACWIAGLGGEHVVRSACAAECSENRRHLIGVTQRAEQAADARLADGHEEVGQVERDHDALADMDCGIGAHRVSAPQAVTRGMQRHQLEDALENAALGGLEPLLGGFDQAVGAGTLGYPTIVVVAHPSIAPCSVEAAPIREPVEVVFGESDEASHIAGRQQWRYRQVAQRRRCTRHARFGEKPVPHVHRGSQAEELVHGA